MRDFEYVPKSEWSEVKKDLISLIRLVQNEVRGYFTFSCSFIGSSSRNMITRDWLSNEGYDFDVDIRPNDKEERYTPAELRNILKAAFDKYSGGFSHDFAEDSKRVLTIKVKDRENSRILHSCDFAIVRELDDGRQQFVFFNKKQRSYEWQLQPYEFYQLSEKVEWCKERGLWQLVRDRYLKKKNANSDARKKSRSIFAETINEIVQLALDEEYDEYDE